MSIGFAESFRGRSVFVTGHTGFKGAWLCLWLHRLGARITGYSLGIPTTPSLFEVAGVGSLLGEHHDADVRDPRALRAAIEAARPDVILHLAAQALVREGYRTPRETFETNVMGTVNTLEAVRGLNRPCAVVVVTSDKCYDNGEHERAHPESDPMGGNDPYSASKGAAELVTAAYRKSFFESSPIRVASARAGNVIGGGDWAEDRIVPDAARALAAGRPVPVRNPDSIRPWQHVLEPLSGYLLLASRLLSSDDPRWTTAWNFGPVAEDAVSVREIVESFCSAWESGTWEQAGQPPGIKEARSLRLETTKAIRELGWRPRWGVSRAVREAALWYRAYYGAARPDVHSMTEQVIAGYEGSGPV